MSCLCHFDEFCLSFVWGRGLEEHLYFFFVCGVGCGEEEGEALIERKLTGFTKQSILPPKVRHSCCSNWSDKLGSLERQKVKSFHLPKLC